MHDRHHIAIPAFLLTNLLLCFLCMVGMSLFGLTLGYGLFFSQDEALEKAYGVVGCLALILPLLTLFLLGLIAGVGLHKRTPWGYVAHIATAAILALTCVALPYSLIAISVALSQDFRDAYFSALPTQP